MIARWDGYDWRTWTVPGSPNLRAIHGTDSDDVFAAGDGGILLRFDGVEWRPVWTPVTANLLSVWVTDAAIVLGGDGVALHGVRVPRSPGEP